VTAVRYIADAAAHPVGPPGPLDGMAGPVQSPPLVGADGGLVYEEEGHGDE
jgi:hypothetical protein